MIKLKKVDLKKKMKRGTRSLNINKLGAVSFSAEFCRQAELKKTDLISFFQEEEKPVNWYLHVSQTDGLPLTGKTDKTYNVYSSSLRDNLYECLGLDLDKNFSFPIGDVIEIDGGVLAYHHSETFE